MGHIETQYGIKRHFFDFLGHPSIETLSLNSMEALHILLRRLSSPNRYIDLSHMFNLRPQYLSVVFNGTIAFLFQKWGNFIRYCSVNNEGRCKTKLIISMEFSIGGGGGYPPSVKIINFLKKI